MNLEKFVQALQAYDVRKRLLAPERYIAMDLFQDCMPEDYPKRSGPPAMPGGEGGPGGPGQQADPSGFGLAGMDDGPHSAPQNRPNPPGGGMPDMGGMMNAANEKEKVLVALLSGEEVDDASLEKALGFSGAALKQALKDADPIIKPLPDKQVLLTFDDSTIDHYTDACPILEKYGFHANLFTTEMESNMFSGASFADKTKFMTWEQIKELSDRGHEVCNHSWHHTDKFQTSSREDKLREIQGLEEQCYKYGIPKPTVFGAPGGQYSPEIEDLMLELGYHWGRGDRAGVTPLLRGSALYDPYVDTPMVVPNVSVMTAEAIKPVLDKCVGKVALLVFHEINDTRMPGPPFEDLIRTIAEYGGKCITFRELEQYVDPVKAHNYIKGVYK